MLGSPDSTNLRFDKVAVQRCTFRYVSLMHSGTGISGVIQHQEMCYFEIGMVQAVGGPAAVIFGKVGAVFSHSGAAFSFEALHSCCLLGSRLLYQIQQLLSPAGYVPYFVTYFLLSAPIGEL